MTRNVVYVYHGCLSTSKTQISGNGDNIVMHDRVTGLQARQGNWYDLLVAHNTTPPPPHLVNTHREVLLEVVTCVLPGEQDVLISEASPLSQGGITISRC